MTKVYRYGLLPPVEGADLVRQQMRAAHDYRNELVFIERARRAALRSLIASHGDVAARETAAAQADETVGMAARALRVARAAGRTRKVSPELLDALARAKEAKRDASKAMREARAASRPVLEAETALINERAAELVRGARALTPAYWGSYLLIERAHEAVKKLPLYDGHEPNDPRFQRWTGEGQIGVQLQKGLATEAVVACEDTRLRIETVPQKRKHPDSKRSARRRAVVLAMRVGSDGRAPVWARWPMILHRELPPGAVVKWAAVSMRRIGPREEWYVTITVEGSAPPRERDASRRSAEEGQRSAGESDGIQEITEGQRTASDGAPEGRPLEGQRAAQERDDAEMRSATVGCVGVDIGWRLLATGDLRVGAWRGSDGAGEEIVLVGQRTASNGATSTGTRRERRKHGNGFLSGMQKVVDLESIRDKTFNAARDAISKFAEGQRAAQSATVGHLESATRPGGNEGQRAAQESATLPLDESATTSTAANEGQRAAQESATTTSDGTSAWFLEATTTLSQWRSQGRLATLVKRWAANRFPGDAEAFTTAEAWRKNDVHLWAWECEMRTRMLRQRRETYRIVAAKLARRYERLVIENFDVRPFARLDGGLEDAQRRNRTLAAVSELRGALVNAFGGMAGGRIVKAPAEYTTLACHACGHVEADGVWDPAKELAHTCTACGTTWDQDDNAARNLLAVGSRVDVEAPAAPSGAGGRWARVKREAAERRASA